MPAKRAVWEHGTSYGYLTRSCRCDPCKKAGAEYNRANRKARLKISLSGDDPRHGTHHGYSNFKCRCDPCVEAAKEYRLLHPGKFSREAYRRRQCKLYGITLEDYEEMLVNQGGGCAICGKPEEDNGKALSIDHDHETGKVRGLLCTLHNKALGHFGDNLEGVMAVVRYLEAANEQA